MNSTETKQLLQQYYNLPSENLPQQREQKDWKPENNFGFLLGIIAHGHPVHIIQLHELLITKQFKEQEQSFINAMFDYYVRPFHKSYTSSESSRTSPANSSSKSSRNNSVDDLDYVPEEKELSHDHFKRAVAKRDVVCLFCWNTLECEGAHLIAQKNIPMACDEDSLLVRAGLKQKHQVQNGLLLCSNCHGQFDKLKRYVDVVDDKLVIKIVNDSIHPNDDKHKDWKNNVRILKLNRSGWQENWTEIDNRRAAESNGKMALYFVQNNPAKLPNRKALEFHKTACLIWRMAGGAEPDEEYCSDDDDLGPVDTAALRKRFKIQDSAATLNVVS